MDTNHNGKFCIEILSINLLGGILSFIFRSNQSNRYTNFFILILLYLAIYFNIRSYERKTWFLIVSIWQYTLMMESIYRIVRLKNTPFETYYIWDLLCVIYTISMVIKYVNRKNRTLKLYLVFLLYGFLTFLFNFSNPYDFVNSFIVAIKYIGFYLYFSNNDFKLPEFIKPFFALSIVAFIVEVALGINVDFRNGLFGYEYTGGLFSLLIVSLSAYLLVKSLCNAKYIPIYVISFVLCEICFILMESKAEIILYGVWSILVFAVLNRKKIIVKKYFWLATLVLMFAGVWEIFSNKITRFVRLKGHNAIYAIISRFNGIQDNKTKYLSIIAHNEMEHEWHKWFGIGMGSSMPPRYIAWIMNDWITEDELFYIGKYSEILRKYFYGRYYQFFSSSFCFITLDCGYIGMFILFFVLISNVTKAVRAINQFEDCKIGIIGSIAMWQIMSLGFRIINNTIVVQHLPMVISFALFGVLHNYSSKYSNE